MTIEHPQLHNALKKLIDLKQQKSAFLDQSTATNPVEYYTSSEWFARERQAIFRALPRMMAHKSELPQAGSFLRRDMAGLPLLLTRDGDGQVHAFLNVCRHRGTRLVDDMSGCRKRFSCPYHAWTWDNLGKLIGVPHGDQGFPDMNRDDFGLKRLPAVESHGWIWVSPVEGVALDIEAYLEGLGGDFHWFGADDLRLLHSDESVRPVNWKILVEGGIEAYHFKIVHRKTIGPHFNDNLSSHELFGPHLRSVLPRTSITKLPQQPENDWDVRAHSNILYSVFPESQLLLLQDHLAWIQMEPLAPDSTRVRISTLARVGEELSWDEERHWQENHRITSVTLDEDFAIGESIQSGLKSGANDHVTFGRFEGALDKFNRLVRNMVEQAERG